MTQTDDTIVTSDALDDEPTDLDVGTEAPHQQRTRFDARRLAPVALVALPAVILFALRVSPYFRLNNGDPFIYVGYSNDLRGHIQRFGYTYHAVRFGLIFPLRASLVFGPVWGYFILRYLLYLLAIIPLYLVLKAYSRRLALLGPVLFVANPVTAEALLTTHPDTIVVPCFTALVCVLVLTQRARGWRVPVLGLLAGVLGGWALNANIFFAPLLAVTLSVFGIVLLLEHRYSDVAKVAITSVVGVAAVCVGGMLTYGHLFGNADIYETTLNAARDISSNSMWRSPSLIWLETRRYTYAPPIAGLLGGLVLWRRRREQDNRSERYLVYAMFAAALLYFFVHQFLLSGNSIETSYYYSYMIGPTCLVVATSVASLRNFRRVPIWLLLAFPVISAYVSQLIELRTFLVFVIVAGGLSACIVGSKSTLAAAATVLLMNLAWGASPRTIAPIAGAGFQYEPHYENAFGSVDDSGYDVYRIASELAETVPSNPAFAVPMRFWYRTGDADLDSIQATYHWETLTVQHSPAAGMPELPVADVSTLQSLVGGYVVLLARTDDEIDAGLASLTAAGFTIGPLPVQETLHHGDVSVDVLPVQLIAGPTP